MVINRKEPPPATPEIMPTVRFSKAEVIGYSAALVGTWVCIFLFMGA